ncbi:MAG: endonuclease III [Candidatus Obscuribacterales bacterium]|nr:endonuclease III [Candidatus Obscuribacterales bacterium]
MAKTASPESKTKTGSARAKKVQTETKTAKRSNQIKLVSKATAHEMMARLRALYPDADCELNFDSPFQLLTAVIMSAQTTDVQVNKVTGKLFSKFPTAKDLAEGDIEEIKEIIKPTGYYNAKAQSIQNCAQQLVLNFGGEVPSTLEELTTLPGVGRKTANVVLGVEFGQRGWTVDTHVQRLTKRFGFTKNDDPYKIELDLQKLFPDDDWSLYSITIIWHGRRMCFARKPDCPACPLKDICPSSEI